ncbi:hypothetical protein [Nitratireductor basaltis]|uniref:Transmembrane protein n=1 Tax=Nitratireductor basaltis TaxID=472175 RepID=A0A084UCD0_9HYPH|nr:hypothetical protein [Nitratireductor basaltis]KFB10616.1 hypothetical protein EL18_01654 [Nitratireductor basaltis]
MDIRAFADQFASEMEALQARGVKTVPIESIVQYLNLVRNSSHPTPTPAELEEFKATLAEQVEFRRLRHETDLEMFKSVILSGQNAIRSMLLVCGGASVALLAFLGHLATQHSKALPLFAVCLAWFAIATLLAASLSCLTYLSQWLYADERTEKIGFGVNVIVIIVALGVIGTFGGGIWYTYAAFLELNQYTLPPNFLTPAAG